MQLYCLPLYLIATLLFASLSSGDLLDDVRKGITGDTKTGVDLNMGRDGAKVDVKSDDGNPFYYYVCSAQINLNSGFGADCERKWKPLFYGLVAGGSVLVALLLTCCCCCCCCRARNRAVATPSYYPVMSQPGSFAVISHQTAPQSSTGYDVPMLKA